MECINDLKPYMLTCKNLSRFTNNIKYIKKKPNNKKYIKEKLNISIFIPYQNDKLFWIYYYIIEGYVSYNMVGSSSYSIEINKKIELTNSLKENKSIFKDYKLKKINDSINELLSNSEISFKTFELLCIINKISFIIIKNNLYHKIIFDDNDDVYIIHIVNNMYGCEKILKESLKNYEINRYEIINYDKPILSIGNYKLDELLNIANLIGVSNYNESDKKLTKQELYYNIVSKINTFFDK